MKYDVMIIGGGAAGLTAALSASDGGARTLLLEASPRVGRKILASGNGRCNLANTGAPRYYGCTALADSVLSACPPARMLAFFRKLGLITVEEEGGRVYPGCGQAAAVLDVLRAALERRNVTVLCSCPVEKLEKTPRGFLAETSLGSLEARRAVAAFGGRAGAGLGHDGSAYALLTALGHRVTPVFPALAPLIAEKSAVRGLSGLRLPAVLTLCDGTAPVEAAQGEALFTDYGVSGVCAMQLARTAGEMLRAGKQPVLYMDFSPMLALTPRIYGRTEAADPFRNTPRAAACLAERRRTLGDGDLLRGLAPRLLAERLKGLSPEDTARLLSAFPVPLRGVRGLEHAQVTAGGIDGSGFDPDTLESLLCPGLYAAGELLDVDGDCGGFNLQFAFASGLMA